MKDYREVINNFSKFNILVVGDVMLDEYIYGDVERISPEAPIPVVNIKNKQQRLGGAANVALNIRSLGATVSLCSVIGNDANSEIIVNLCRQNNIKTNFVFSDNRPTTVKTRIISQRQHLLRIDNENDDILNDNEENKFIKTLNHLLSSENFNAVIFEDYDKGVLTKNSISFLIDYCNKNSIVTTVDPKFRNFNYYANCTLFKPNFKEFSRGIGNLRLNKNNINELTNFVNNFRIQNSIKIILITLSEKGMLIVTDNETHYLPTQVIEVADVSGAGDTVISISTLCLLAGLSVYDIAFVSNVAAGIVCQKIGVVPITANELLNHLQLLLK
ncbi:MAG: D-glycero-beta-D-manno-heptose-7-phosphate kinase [Bacteroidales bacterium]|nr:D-glycero-beta-D-manno-heptose-7-phosphate kinase [Bacteroidales bacterium]